MTGHRVDKGRGLEVSQMLSNPLCSAASAQADVLHNLRAKIRDLRAQMERLGIYTVRALAAGEGMGKGRGRCG